MTAHEYEVRFTPFRFPACACGWEGREAGSQYPPRDHYATWLRHTEGVASSP